MCGGEGKGSEEWGIVDAEKGDGAIETGNRRSQMTAGEGRHCEGYRRVAGEGKVHRVVGWVLTWPKAWQVHWVGASSCRNNGQIYNNITISSSN